MSALRVIFVDDHPVFRDGLRVRLSAEEDIEVVAELGNGEEAFASVQELSPDVVITDVNLPGMNGLQLVRELRAVDCKAACIVVTAYDDEEQMYHALRAGALAYFSKDVAADHIVAAIRQVVQGKYVVRGQVFERFDLMNWLARRFRSLSLDEIPDETIGPLSPREMEILRYIAQGRSNKEIAHQLGISRQTVKNHMSNILRKLAVEDRTQAVMYAVRRGWIRVQDAIE
ncbi:MAG: response regulator [Anaerolineae bacterium]